MNARPLVLLATLLSLLQLTAQNTNKATRDDVLRLLTLTKVDSQLRTMLPDMFVQMKKAQPDVPASEWRELEKQTNPEEILALAIPIYEKHLTKEEIEGIIAFYQSPVGKKTLEKLPIITKEIAEAGQQWGERLVARVRSTNSHNERPISEPKQTSPQPRTADLTPLTPEVKERSLRNQGYDPALYDIDDFSFDIVPRVKKQDTAIVITNSSRFLIQVNNGGTSESYFSEKKPKQSGNSYIIQDIRGFEVTVSGSVRIIDFGAKK